MITIDWIAMKNIQVRHEYQPTAKNAQKKHRLFLTRKPHLDVYRTPSGELFLKKGLDAYNTFMALDPDKRVPVLITDKDINKMEWTFQLLHSCFVENVNFKIRYEYIMLLLEETNSDIDRICSEVGCFRKDIDKYILNWHVPDRYKELAFQYARQTLVNKICQDSTFEGYRPLLYKATFQPFNRLTHEKLSMFKKFIQAGYSIDVNSSYALLNLQKITDKNQACLNHWDFLMANDPFFNNKLTSIRKIYM